MCFRCAQKKSSVKAFWVLPSNCSCQRWRVLKQHFQVVRIHCFTVFVECSLCFAGSPLDPDLLRNCALTKLRMILIDERLANPGAPIVLSSTHAGVVSFFSPPRCSCFEISTRFELEDILCELCRRILEILLLTWPTPSTFLGVEVFFFWFNLLADFLYCVDLLSWPKITFCSLCLWSPIRKRDFLRMPNFWTLFVIKGWCFGFFVVFFFAQSLPSKKKKHGCGDFSQSCSSSAQLFDLQQDFSSAKVRKIRVRFFYLKKILDLSCIMLKLECRWQTKPSRDE